jgi:uncharacterized protein (DUF58 family)
MTFFQKWHYSLFLGKRFFRFLAAIIALFLISYEISFLFQVAVLALILLLLTTLLDWFILFSKKKPVMATRELPERMSNGEENIIYWKIKNHFPFTVSLQLIDEFPANWQLRNIVLKTRLESGKESRLFYSIKPKERGEFEFGRLHLYLRTSLQIIVRRSTLTIKDTVRIYPAFLMLRQFEFMAHITDPGNAGYKQVRKTGHSLEFEQIREYVSGDDIRSINWRATGRTGGQLMINNYTDEKSQQIYCILDKGRTMKMAFEELSLLDHAVNATLALSSVAITRQDRAGFISFADRNGDFLPASHRATQMAGIVNSLYNVTTKFLESDFSFLHHLIKTRVTQRSLLILFTNFESLTALNRQLPYLRSISTKHLLLVVFFENTSLRQLASGEVTNVEKLYEKVIAEKFILEKKLIVKELQRYGIASLLTPPGQLSVNVINRYLQIKARREI